MVSRSITRQTVLIVLVAQTLFAVCLAAVAVLSVHHTRMRALAQTITGRSDSLLGAIQDAEDPDSNILIDPQELRLPAQDRYAVYSDNGSLIGRSLQAGPALPMQGAMGESTARFDGETYSVLRRTAMRIIDRSEYGGVGLRRPVVIVYASSRRFVLHEVWEAITQILAAIIVTSVIVALITAVLIRRTLQPIRDLAVAAQQVSPSSLQFQAPAGALQVVELKQLATTFSSLIDELREAFAKEQRFVGDAAHELKTAVAVVRSSIQLLMLRRRNEDEYVAGLERLLLDNDRVETLVASMLQLARADQVVPENTPLLDLVDCARQACATMQPVAEQRSIALCVKAEAHRPVRLHPDQADTLLTNLLSNAIRHSHPGTAVRIIVDQRDNSTVCLKVEDDGHGIRPEALPHVFERFYRDDPSRARTSGGSGLGLAICESLVRTAGGSIQIASEVGRGTTVSVFFSAN